MAVEMPVLGLGLELPVLGLVLDLPVLGLVLDLPVLGSCNLPPFRTRREPEFSQTWQVLTGRDRRGQRQGLRGTGV